MGLLLHVLSSQRREIKSKDNIFGAARKLFGLFYSMTALVYFRKVVITFVTMACLRVNVWVQDSQPHITLIIDEKY